MALPATGALAMMDTCTTARSIAREVYGNVTPPKTLCAASVSAGKTAPHCQTEFYGFSSGIDASVCCYSTVGSTFSCCDCKFGCIKYSGAFAAGQTWCACFSWTMEATRQTSGLACACFYVRCNGVNKASCFIQRTSNGTTSCNGSLSVGPIDSNDTVCMVVFTRSQYGGGGGYGYANSCIFMYCSYANVNGGVNLVSPQDIAAYGIASY